MWYFGMISVVLTPLNGISNCVYTPIKSMWYFGMISVVLTPLNGISFAFTPPQKSMSRNFAMISVVVFSAGI